MALFTTSATDDSPDAVTSDMDLLNADDKDFDKLVAKSETVVTEKPVAEEVEEPVEAKAEEETEEQEPTEEELDLEPEKSLGLQSKLETEYPGISKKFPNLRHIIYSEKAFREVYPTVKEAKTAAETVTQMQIFEETIGAGNPDLLLSSVKSGLGEESLERLAHNFLPALKKAGPDIHYAVVSNIAIQLLQHVSKIADERIAAKAEYGEDLKHAAEHISNLLFKSPKIPDVKNVAPVVRDDKSKQLTSSLSKDFIDTTTSKGSDVTIELIEESIKELKLTPFAKRNLGREIYEEIETALESDSRYQSLMKSLWDRALSGVRSGRLPDDRTRLIHTLRERVKDLLPAIRAKKLAEVMPNREKQVVTTPKKLPATGGGKTGSKELTLKTVKENKMSDMDIIMQGASE